MPAGFIPNNWQDLLIVATAIRLGLFEALDQKPGSAADLALRMGYDQRATGMLLSALAEMKHVRQAGDIFHLAPGMRAVAIDKSSPAYSPYAILHSWNLMERWLTIPDVVKTGRPVKRSYTRERREVFIRSMDDNSRSDAPRIVKKCLEQKPALRSVIDIGGGPGTYARLFAEHGIKVTILDRPEVIEMIRDELSDIAEISLVSGDFTHWLPPERFDLAILGNIMHIYGPEENQELLLKVRNVLNPGGVAAIVDIVRGRSSRAALFAMTMLVNTETGGTWTEDQYISWLREAGFGNVKISDLEKRDSQLILADLL
ncbi:MAG: methyltransferase [Thermoleophilia bacterium]